MDDYSGKSLIYRYFFLNFGKMANCGNNQKTNIMKTEKETYESPLSIIMEIKIQGILCQSNLEPITPGDEHGWEYYDDNEY